MALSSNPKSSLNQLIEETLAKNKEYQLIRKIEEDNYSFYDMFLEFKQYDASHHSPMTIAHQVKEDVSDVVIKIAKKYGADVRTSTIKNSDVTDPFQKTYDDIRSDFYSPSPVARTMINERKDLDEKGKKQLIKDAIIMGHKYFGVKADLWMKDIYDDDKVAEFVLGAVEETKDDEERFQEMVRKEYNASMPLDIKNAYLRRAQANKEDDIQEQHYA